MLKEIKEFFKSYYPKRENNTPYTKKSTSFFEVVNANDEAAIYSLFYRKDVQEAIQDVEDSLIYTKYYNIFYKCYNMISIVSSCVSKITDHLTTCDIQIDEEEETEENEKINKILNSVKFKKKIIDFFIKAHLYGFGAFQLGEYQEDKKEFKFFSVIPEILINPAKKKILNRAGQDYVPVVDFTEELIGDQQSFFFYFESEKGVLSKCFNDLCLLDISQAYMTSAIDGELRPFMLMKADIQDENRRRELTASMSEMLKTRKFLTSTDGDLQIISVPSDGVRFSSEEKEKIILSIRELLLGSPDAVSTNYRQADAQMTSADLRFRSYETMLEGMLDSYDFKRVLTYAGVDVMNKKFKLVRDNKDSVNVSLEKIKVLTNAGYRLEAQEIKEMIGVEVEEEYKEPDYMNTKNKLENED